MNSFTIDDSALETTVCTTAAEAGSAAGTKAAHLLRHLLGTQPVARVAFAAAPSQDFCLRQLRTTEGIDWDRVVAFQLDDYVGLRPGAPGTFAEYLDNHLFGFVRPGTVHRMRLDGDPRSGERHYADLVAERPLDLVLLGIGENGHLAFNDPPHAQRHDPQPTRLVTLDETSRVQQVNDGCFPTLESVPPEALTLTLPSLLSARSLVCTVVGERKKPAIERTLFGPISTECPASYLREHPAAHLYLDAGSAPSDHPPSTVD
ncbi:6-phosphogluconolactonase [Sciscionella marina]|uniref:6-phosphogluconolactonase n=1 Tax=Sciscionella marina TaxID=508770 RepID=UPI00037E85D5|nr:6-phosphogluconolactonase [Sciscionella marina]